MEADANIPPLEPPLPPQSAPPVLDAAPPPSQKPGAARRFLAIFLSVCLALFLADAFVSFLDDSLIIFFGVHVFSAIRMLTGFFVLLLAVVVYVLMALTPIVPKRIFLPLALFSPAATLAMFALMIYFYDRVQWVVWWLSLSEVVLALILLCVAQGGFRFRWPLVREDLLGGRNFSWVNSIGFTGANVFGLLPAVIVYVVFCGALAVDHFTNGFTRVRPAGITMQTRTYVRDDGRKIELVPMSHVADLNFYRHVSSSFPDDATILLEGVTDKRNLITNNITYKRMAKSIGAVEQHEAFKPRGELVAADVDVGVFSPETISFLNVAMRVHSKGLTAENLIPLLEFPQSAHFQEQLLDDLLLKRNEHLLGEIHSHLADTNEIIVPWGAAHMPGIEAGIRKEGFRLADTKDYVAIGFGPGKKLQVQK